MNSPVTWLVRPISFLGVLLAFALRSLTAVEPEPELLWPEGAPGGEGVENREKIQNRSHQQNELGLNRSCSQVSVPEITIYSPDKKAEGKGAAVIICPGGGYSRVVIDKEGHDVARRLQKAGVTGVVLKYRNPRPDISGEAEPWPQQDAKQAIRLIRSRAAELGLDPKRIGVMGFSAGGHLAASVSVHWDKGDPEASDPVGKVSSRPDFSVLIYPVITFDPAVGHGGSRSTLLGKSPEPELIRTYSCELQVDETTPPAFLVHARDDGVKVENTLLYAGALKKSGVRHEVFLLDSGGHGFGLGLNGGKPAEWPDRFLAWLED